jgi:Reverse transcriptase (RNA-dependent DNA polymerase)
MSLKSKLPFDRFDGQAPWKQFSAQFQAYLVTKNILDLGLPFPLSGFLTGESDYEKDSILSAHGYDISDSSYRDDNVWQFDNAVRLVYQHLVLATAGDALQEVLLHSSTRNGYLAFRSLAHRFRGSAQLHASALFRELRSITCSGTSREDVQSFYTRFRTLLVDLANCGQPLAPQLAYEFYRDALPSSLMGLKLSAAAGNIDFEDPAGLALYHENIVRILEPASTKGHAHIATGQRPTLKCHNCGKPGHKKAECHSRLVSHASKPSAPYSSSQSCARCRGPHAVQHCDKATIKPSSKCRKCRKGFHWTYDCRSSHGSARQALSSEDVSTTTAAPAPAPAPAPAGQAKNVIAEAVPPGYVVPGPNSYIFTTPPTAKVALGTAAPTSLTGSVITIPASPGFALRTDDTTLARICLDSGASHHMSPDHDFFSEIQPLDHTFLITCADKQQISAAGIGTLSLPIHTDSGVVTLHFTNVYYVPQLLDTLLSMGTLIDSPNRVHVDDRSNLRVDFPIADSILSAPLELHNRLLYFMKAAPISSGHASAVTATTLHDATPDPAKITLLQLWHERTHLPAPLLKSLHHNVEGVPRLTGTLPVCDPCALNRATKTPVSKQPASRTPVPASHTWHWDIAGPFPKSHSNFDYAPTFVDEHSRFIVTSVSKGKDVLPALQDLNSRYKPKKLFSDGEPLMTQGDPRTFAREHGIDVSYAPHHTPALNGIVERSIRTVDTDARTLLAAAHLSVRFWPEARAHAAWIRNRIPRSPDNKTPFELLFKKSPDMSPLRRFGCVAYVTFPSTSAKKPSKTAPHAWKGIFLGFDPDSPGSVFVYNPSTRRLISTRDVFRYDEHTLGADVLLRKSDLSDSELIYDALTTATDPDDPGSDSNSDDLPTLPRRSARLTGHAQQTQTVPDDLDISGIPKLIDAEVLSPDEALDHAVVSAFAFLVQSGFTFKKAMESPHKDQWLTAICDEWNSLLRNETFELVSIDTLPYGSKLLGNQWVLTEKFDSDGQLLKRKARLVALGNHQVPGIDFTETFAPTVQHTTLRTLLAVAASRQYSTAQLDVSTAYLNAPLDETIYMRLPPGFDLTDSTGRPLVARLRKSLYGLCQAGRNWYRYIIQLILSLGFTQSRVDPCLLISTSQFHADASLFVVIHVDDFPMAASKPEALHLFNERLGALVKLTFSAPLQWCLGLRVDHTPDGIIISQPRHITSLIESNGLTTATPQKTPTTTERLSAKSCPAADSEEQQEMASVPYKSLVGSLNYIATLTRPDIAYAVHRCAAYMQNPGRLHFTAAKRVARYLKATPHFGLFYPYGTALDLHAYVDSDWAGDSDDRRSITGYIIILGLAAVSWKSRKQPSVALSTAEAEYMAAAYCVQDVLFLLMLLADFGVQPSLPVSIHEDNSACIDLVSREFVSDKTKHIDIRYHFLRQHALAGRIAFHYIASAQQLADVLTKPVPLPAIAHFQEKVFALVP